MALQVRLCYNKYIQFALRLFYGRVAQLGERLVRNEEVVGSIPITSTIKKVLQVRAFFMGKCDKNRIADELQTRGAFRPEVSGGGLLPSDKLPITSKIRKLRVSGAL